MILEIHGRRFPGRSWHLDDASCHNVHCGIQIGREPHELVPGDAESAIWRTDLRVLTVEDGLDFRGPAVQARRGERFVYLTWGNLEVDGRFAMFRRAKLMLSDVAALIGAAAAPARVVATVDLTDECGGPRCARLRPPALHLSLR